MSTLKLLPIPLLLLAACSSASGGDSTAAARNGSLEILATDGPMDPSLVKHAMVDVTKVRIHAETTNESESGWVTLFDGGPISLDLSLLRNGITQTFAQGDLAPGTYRQLRVHFSGGGLELQNGNMYQTSDGSLTMPSSMTESGYKIFLDPPVVVPEGGREQIVLDFALTRTFEPVPANDPENAVSYRLHPNIRAAVMSVSGEVRAVVRRDDGTGTLVGVPDVMVHVLLPGETDLANALAISITDDTGSAAVLGLYPQTYDVVAKLGSDTVRVDSVLVSTGEASMIELVLP